MSDNILTADLIFEKMQQKYKERGIPRKSEEVEAILKEKYEYLVKKVEDCDLPIKIEISLHFMESSDDTIKSIVYLLNRKFPSENVRFCYTHKCSYWRDVDNYTHHTYEINMKRNNNFTILYNKIKRSLKF